jgi:hypothetical protein
MTPIEPVEVILDKPRKLLINHFALYRAEAEVNKLRFAKPEDYASIDALMVDGFNNLYRARGMMPMDLLLCLITFGMVYDDPKERRLTVDQVAALLDVSESDRGTLSGTIWGAYFKLAGRNLKVATQGDVDAEKKTTDQPTGSNSGRSDVTTLN